MVAMTAIVILENFLKCPGQMKAPAGWDRVNHVKEDNNMTCHASRSFGMSVKNNEINTRTLVLATKEQKT